MFYSDLICDFYRPINLPLINRPVHRQKNSFEDTEPIKPLAQNTQSEGFRDIRIRVVFERPHDAVNCIFTCDHHKRGGSSKPAGISGLFQDLLSILSFPKVVVRQHQVEVMLHDVLYGLSPIRSRIDIIGS